MLEKGIWGVGLNKNTSPVVAEKFEGGKFPIPVTL